MELKWKRLKAWHEESPAKYYGIPEGCVGAIKKLLDAKVRVEVLAEGSGEHKLRIPVQSGYDSALRAEESFFGRRAEIYPVNDLTWAVIVSGGHWANRVREILGDDCRSASGKPIIDVGRRYEELTIHFPAGRLVDVLRALRPYKRIRGGVGNANALRAYRAGACQTHSPALGSIPIAGTT